MPHTLNPAIMDNTTSTNPLADEPLGENSSPEPLGKKNSFESLGEDNSPEPLRQMTSGEWHYGFAPEIAAALARTADLCFRLNSLPPSAREERDSLLRSMLGGAGRNLCVHSPFRCDFGSNIRLGDNLIANFNLTILDEGEVTIGDNVFIGPNCGIYTIIHALLPEQRNAGIMRSRPVRIGDNVWLGAAVTVLPGVIIGDGAVIGAGSVVTRDIPAGVLAAGNPCRPLRPLEPERDRAPFPL